MLLQKTLWHKSFVKISWIGDHLRYPLPYPLPGFFPTTLPEPYPKSKSPTRHSLFLTHRSDGNDFYWTPDKTWSDKIIRASSCCCWGLELGPQAFTKAAFGELRKVAWGLEGVDDTWTHWVRHCRPVRKLEKLACAFPRVPGHCRHQYSAGTLRHFGTLLGTLGTICGSFAGILGEYLEFFWQFGAFLGHFWGKLGDI